MEVLNELRKEIFNIIQNKEMPTEVELLINLTKREIKKIYNDSRILDSTMEEYIENQFQAMKPQLNKIKEEKNNSDYEIINNTLTNIGLKISEPSPNAMMFDAEKESDREFLDKGRKYISSINMKNESIKTSKNIIVTINDIIEDIRNKANRRELLDQRQMEDLNYSISKFKNYINSQMPTELMGTFEKENQELLKLVYEKYEYYYYLNKNNSEKSTDNSSIQDDFRKQLDAKISLKKQNENALKFVEEKEESSKHDKKQELKALPDDVLK